MSLCVFCRPILYRESPRPPPGGVRRQPDFTPLHYRSLFEGTYANLRNLIHSAIAWFYCYPYQYRVRECGLSALKTDELDVLLNVLAYEELRTNSERIGGPLRVVEIDEALLRCRKYNRGRAKEELWILGGVEGPVSATEKPRMFLVPLPDRTQSTIEDVIKEWVEPQSIICTDASIPSSNFSRSVTFL